MKHSNVSYFSIIIGQIKCVRKEKRVFASQDSVYSFHEPAKARVYIFINFVYVCVCLLKKKLQVNYKKFCIKFRTKNKERFLNKYLFSQSFPLRKWILFMFH